jgi:hypothetical protein
VYSALAQLELASGGGVMEAGMTEAEMQGPIHNKTRKKPLGVNIEHLLVGNLCKF